MANEGTPALEAPVSLPVPGAELEPKVVAETAEVKGEEAPTAKDSYSKAEYEAALELERKRYSGLDSKFTKSQAGWEETTRSLQADRDAALAQIEEAKYSSFLSRVEQEGGDVDVAKMIIARERAATQKERDVKTLESWVKQQQSILNEAGKGKQAHDLIKEHGLNETQLGKLLEAANPLEMENLALKLRLEKSKIEQRPPRELDSNRGNKPVGDIGKLPPSVALGQLMDDSGK